MKNYKLLIIVVTLMLIICGVSTAAIASELINHVAVLPGVVVADGLIKEGQQVKEGYPLVYIKTAIGNAVTSRATVDGNVYKVIVKPGQSVGPNEVVVIINRR